MNAERLPMSSQCAVRFPMKLLVAGIAFSWSALAIAEKCGESGAKHWTTVLASKPAVTLHWTGVHEGVDSVCEITYSDSEQPQALGVWGQPVANKDQSLVAFVSCADDGCDKSVSLVDIARRTVLKTELALSDSQFYLKARWLRSGKAFRVELEHSPIRFHCEAEQTLVCTRTESH